MVEIVKERERKVVKLCILVMILKRQTRVQKRVWSRKRRTSVCVLTCLCLYRFFIVKHKESSP